MAASRWYLIQTKRSGEEIAESNLERQGYEVYLPRLVRVTRARGRRKQRVVALFPRYLFLRLRVGSQELAPVRSTIGVASIVRFGTSYAKVPDDLIQVLKSRAEPQSGLHRLELPASPKPGASVRIADGPFRGLEGVFERESGDERAVVLLDLLGCSTRVHVPLDSILSDRAA